MRHLLAPIALLVLLVAGCGDDRVAGGTGTSAGNTITARVLGPDGAPAAQARIVLRPMGYVPGAIGISESSGPGSRMETSTDTGGRFTFENPTAGSYMIECFRDLPTATLVSWTENVRLGTGETRDLGPLRLDTAAGLTGIAQITDSAGRDNLWAGFPGTEHFAHLDSDLRFALSGFPAHWKAFTLYRKRPTGDWQQIKVGGWEFQERETRPGVPPALVPFTLPDISSKDTSLDMKTQSKTTDPCPESAFDTLNLDRTTELSVQPLRMRAIVIGTLPQWVELDPCKGSWRIVIILPSTPAPPFFSFASRAGDFILMPGGVTYYRFTGAVTTYNGASFAGVTGVVNHQGKYHVLYGPEKAYVSVADTSFLHGAQSPQPVFPLLDAPDSLAGIAWLGDRLFAHTTQATQAPIYSHDTLTHVSKLHEVKDATGAPIRIMALVKASETALWLLDENSRLLLWDAASATVVRTWQVKASAPIRTLSRYPD